jgi:competence protein ComEC
VAASAAAEIVLLPVTAAVFNRVTFAGLLLNLLAVPLMTVAQVAGLVAVAAGSVEWIAGAAGALAAVAAKGLVESARLVDVAPWLAVRVVAPSMVTVTLYYVGLGAALWWPRGRLLPRALVAAAGLAILAGATPATRSAADAGLLRLTAFDVGQGEALLLRTPSGRAVMVDAGGAGFDGTAFDIGGRVLAPALWARGVRRLEVLALTHGDPDHAGGAAAILRDFAPRALWEGIPVARHAPVADLLAQARRRGIPVVPQRSGATLTTDSVTIRVLHPPAPDWERQRVRNDDSLVLEIRYGEVSILLTGDVSREVERAIVPMLSQARIRILKVAHHGSRTSTSQELLDAFQPQMAVISCGRGNPFGHPAPEVVRRLAAAGVATYRTDRDGQITVVTDGKATRVRTRQR